MSASEPLLFVAATDIGNPDDNTHRLQSILESSDIVFVESFKRGSKLLKSMGVRKEMYELSEHTTEEELAEYEVLLYTKRGCIISDAGTPLMEDPGRHLVRKAHAAGIRVSPLPGASSLTAAIMLCPFPMRRFHYAGLLSRDKQERVRELKSLANMPYPAIILDTPYRFAQLFDAVCRSYPHQREILLAFALTTETEDVFAGTIAEARQLYHGQEIKKNFVCIIDGAPQRPTSKGKKGSKGHYQKRR